ncbi:Uncharacterized protein DAT39_018630, partial [Clarias magur]
MLSQTPVEVFPEPGALRSCAEVLEGKSQDASVRQESEQSLGHDSSRVQKPQIHRRNKNTRISQRKRIE